ncbi:MAG TPA: hypothetical protein VFL83_03985 [Anaeromyxobacter sp.]|nr:hypothetical protein [Anaeromyxobacter sp.]
MERTPTIEDLLRDDEEAILAEALARVARLEHYRRDGDVPTRDRLVALHRRLARAVRTRDLDDLLAHAERVARERCAAGFDLAEVHAAFSALEEAIWRRASDRLALDEQAWGLALVTTALAHAKEALGRAYLAAAPSGHAPSVDLTPVFRRTSRRAAPERRAEEFVHPV